MKKEKLLVLTLLSSCFGLFVSCSKKCDHDYVEHIVTEANCEQGGETQYVCSKCNDSYTIQVDPLGHGFGTINPKVEASCLEGGHEAYYQCGRCGKYFDENKNETSYSDILIQPKGHSFVKEVPNETYLKTPADCTHSAIYYKSCECGEHNEETFAYGDPLGHSYGVLISQTTGDCLTPGYKAHYICGVCNEYFDENKNQTTLEQLSLGKTPHSYILTSDGMHYECNSCHNQIASGKEEIGMAERKNYIFLGSSIANGYDSTTPNNPYSVADMFKEDYIQISYKYYNMSTFVNRDDVYMRKVEDVANNNDGVGGKYQWYDEKVILDGNGNGVFKAYKGSTLLVTSNFEYEVKGSFISIKEASDYVYDLFGHFYKGNLVHKHTQNGYTLSRHEKYTADGQLINPATNYCYLLEQAISQHKNERIDTLIFQLSTNDVGSYLTSAGTSSGHIPFGTITPDDVKKSDAFDQNTSFGALEWIIAKAIETWNCKVVLFTCHMSTGEYATYKANDYDLSKVVTPYAEMYQAALKAADKWQIGLIDLFANKQANIDIHEDAARCLSDSLHLHRDGYEKVFYPIFRGYCDKEGY